jgi:hypothetical protein
MARMRPGLLFAGTGKLELVALTNNTDMHMLPQAIATRFRQRDMNSLDTRYVRNATFAVGVLFQSKWRVQILCAMRSERVRLGQLARLIPAASKKMLTQNLRQLEADGIVVRKF